MTAPKIEHKNIKEKRLSPILKWAGGKEQELKHIHPHLPKKINNYYFNKPRAQLGYMWFNVFKHFFLVLL